MESASCARIWDALAEGAPLEGRDADHLSECPSCAAGAAGFARLDALLGSEPAPLAPPDLAPRILEQVADRWRAELARWRRQALACAAAVVIAGLGLGLGVPSLGDGVFPTALPDLVPASLGDLGSGSSLADLAWARSRAAAEALRSDVDGALGALLAAPTPPWILLLVAAPALVAVHWTIGRGAAGADRGDGEVA